MRALLLSLWTQLKASSSVSSISTFVSFLDLEKKIENDYLTNQCFSFHVSSSVTVVYLLLKCMTLLSFEMSFVMGHIFILSVFKSFNLLVFLVHIF